MLDSRASGYGAESDSSDEPDLASSSAGSTVTQCGSSTVHISNLNVDNKFQLKTNTFSTNAGQAPSTNKTQDKAKTIGKKTSMLKLVTSGISRKNLKHSLFKAASIDAEKTVKRENRMMRKRKKKVQVTEL